MQSVRFCLALFSYILYEDDMDTIPSSVPALIDRWRFISEFAADIGCGYEAARQMRRRESIAPEHWSRVVDAATQKGIPGVTLDWLAEQRSRSSVKTGVAA